MGPSDAAVRERFQVVLELFDLAEAMMRAKLRREDPSAPPEEIERRLEAWLAERPGAELGDSPGRQIELGSRR